MSHYSTKALLGCVASAAVLSVSGAALAVPYAAQVSQTGSTVSYVLNEPATSVTVTRDGGSPLVMPTTAGVASFDMTGFSSYSIDVSNTQAAGWVESPSSAANGFLEFERPRDVVVNNNPGSEHFGTVYVSNPRDVATASGRTMTDGIYVLNADASDIDGTALPSDVVSRTAGFTFAGSTSSSPWRMAVDADDNLLLSIWSDGDAGVRITDPTVTTGELLLAEIGDANANTTGNHGSVVSRPVFTGSLSGGDFTLYTIDEDRESSGGAGTGNNIWRYDIGSSPGATGYAGAANIEVDNTLLGTNSDGSPIFLDLNVGVLNELIRDPKTGNWIELQQRANGSESGMVIFSPDFSTVLWNSKEFSITNNLDGTLDDLLNPDSLGVQDIFRWMVGGTVTPDGSTLMLHRRLAELDNEYLGTANVLMIPLDASGLPDLDVSDPVADPLLGITEVSTLTGGGSTSVISYDLAGNIYTASNVDEKVTIFGPGGNSTAVTNSDGTFVINGVTYGGGGSIPGDLDGDGFVGLSDLDIILNNWNLNVPPGNPLADPTGDGFVGLEDLDILLNNWNAGTPPGNAVPEPASLALLGLGAIAALRRR